MARQAIGDYGDDDFSAELEMSIRSELAAKETVVWTGRPRSLRRLVIRTVPKALFGLAFLAFIFLWMVMVVQGGNNNWDQGRAVRPFEPHNVLIATFVGLWMVSPGLYLLTCPAWTWRRLRRTCYVLTDRRAIISEPGLLGQPKVRDYSAGRLRLMRLEEHDDGTGDLIFESPSTWVGMAQPVGFIGIEHAGEVEMLVRRTLLSGEPGPRRADPPSACPSVGGQTYRISPVFRLYQVIALVVGALAATCLVADVAIALVVLVLMPRNVFATLARVAAANGWPGPLGVAGCLVAGVGSLAIAGLVAVLAFRAALGTPTEIVVHGDGRVEFRSRLRTVVLDASDIISITTGAWYDPNRFHAVVRYKGGKRTLINQFANFRDFLVTLRELNPTVEIKGF